jgi:hypothetical protein
MDLRIRWQSPIDLVDGSRDDLIYAVTDLDIIPEKPGVYVFARVHSDIVAPLYIGRAKDLKQRIDQQLNNVRLMRGIERSPKGYRTLYVGEFQPRPAQKSTSALKIIEAALISAAMVEGFELLNVSGTKTLAHSITSTGNREARTWLPENIIKLRRA